MSAEFCWRGGEILPQRSRDAEESYLNTALRRLYSWISNKVRCLNQSSYQSLKISVHLRLHGRIFKPGKRRSKNLCVSVPLREKSIQ